jgi:hypothetical protein
MLVPLLPQNLVNPRREFFYATPGEVRAHLAQHAGHLLDFVLAVSVNTR